MMRIAARALMVTLVLVVLTGIVYPLAVTGIAQIVFRHQAEGSLVRHDGRVVGSRLIGQAWDGEEWFYGRPSAVDYDAASSGGSNLGPTSPVLVDQIRERAQTILIVEGPYHQRLLIDHIPPDLLLASGSGLDPDISPEAATFQAPRIAAVRGIPVETVYDLIRDKTGRPPLDLFGAARVNVLALNLALDALRGTG